jgi:fructose-1,6-bisphosphatase/inositol monophosphatase family enzyme
MKKRSRHDALGVGEILAEVARAEIMPRFDGVVANSVRTKASAFDVVTDADEAAEREIAARLRQRFPGAVVIGEEAAAHEPDLLARIVTADLAFMVDPLDGTKNFASGVPLFGVMVAGVVRGDVVLGVVHDPVCRDTSYAVRGEGAWRQREGSASEDLEVAAAVPLAQMHAVAGTNFLPEPLRSSVTRNLGKLSMTFWLRCAAHEYRMAAAGHCHVLMYNRLMPWDHAAGWLLHKEAGGCSAHFDGTAYEPSHLAGGLICAPDPDSWLAVREALLGDAVEFVRTPA